MKNKEQDVITGLMLSDAHLRKPGPNRRVHMAFTLKYADFASSIQKQLISLPWGKSSVYRYADRRTGKTYVQNRITTKVSDYLTSIYPLWYNNGKKVVPEDLAINSEVLLWWYLGDGHLHKKKNRPNYRRICLSTDSFSDEEIQRLIELLQDMLGDSSIYEEHKRIMIASDALCSFVSKVGDISPVSIYQYKFDFGQYADPDYKAKSYKSRPLAYINKFRKRHKVRELEYVNNDTILIKEKQDV